MAVAQRLGTHVRELDRPLRTGIHEVVAVYWVELGGGDDLGQLLHVDWLDINDVYTRAVQLVSDPDITVPNGPT